MEQEISFFLFAAWPLLAVFAAGALLISAFHGLRRFKSYFGLAFIAFPGWTLCAFSLIGLLYGVQEINSVFREEMEFSVAKIKENTPQLLSTIKEGHYLETAKLLNNLAPQARLRSAKIYLVPSGTLVAATGATLVKFAADAKSNILLTETDIDGTEIPWAKVIFEIEIQAIQSRLLEIQRQWRLSTSFAVFILVLASLAIAFLFFKHLKRSSEIIRSLNATIRSARSMADLTGALTSRDKSGDVLVEDVDLSRNLDLLAEGLRDLHERLIKSEADASLGRLAAQVSHDIRSPLSALNMVVGSLRGLPEEKRLIIRNATQRINDIANGLLQQGKKAPVQSELQNNNVQIGISETIMLVALLDTSVSEKRVQFRERMAVEILGDFEHGYGLFANVIAIDFARAVSNLVNNAVEAFSGPGCVIVGVRGNKDQVIVTVRDNGKGIPPHILARLGERGLTHGKEGIDSGSGLGVYHARETVERAGGTFKIESQVDVGTTIYMTLPRAETPKWFFEKLSLRPGAMVVSADDDQTIHQIWGGRLSSVGGASDGVQHLMFSSLGQFEEWVNGNRHTQAVFLVDYEFIGQNGNGLEVIERLGITGQVALVTSRYEEPQIQAKAEALGVKILPKSLAPFVPIELTRSREKYDAILIDDDTTLMHITWQLAARENDKRLLCFGTPEEFVIKASEIDPSSPVYIDVSLGNGVRGEDVASQVHALGFTEIRLATGYDASELTPPPCVRAVVGKEPAF